MARTKQTTTTKSLATKMPRRAVKEPMKASLKSRVKFTPKDIAMKKNSKGAQRLKERVVETAAATEEETPQHHQRIMRKGAGRRAVVRETSNSITNIVSKTRFRRMVKAVCQELGTNQVVVPPLFDGSKPFKGFKNGLTRGTRTRSGNLTIEPNDKLLRIQFGQNTLYTVQQVTEREMAKIVEHALQARIEQMSDKEREEAQGTNIRIRPQQVEGALFRYYEEKDPMTLTYFRHFVNLLGKECSVSASRVA